MVTQTGHLGQTTEEDVSIKPDNATADNPESSQPEEPPKPESRRRLLNWRNPFTSRMYRNILWSLIPPALLLIVLSERISLGYTHSWIIHSLVTLFTVLVIVAAVCATILRPLTELLRAQTKRLAEGSDHAVVSERYCRSDEIGDIIRNHNRIIYGIRDARERYQSLVEGLDAVIYEANASTQRFTYVSPQLQSLLGYPADTWTTDPGSWVHQLHPDDRADAMRKWLEKKTSATEQHSEYRLQRSDGEYVWVRDVMRVVTRIDPATGQPYHQLQGVILDISREKDVEQQLRRSEVRFRATFDHAGVGVAIMGSDGRLIDSNAALQQVLGYTSEELSQRSFMDVTHPEDIEPDLTLAQELFAGQRDVYKLEKRFICKNGEVRWGRLTGTAVRDENGNVRFGVSMVEDITERKHLEEHLRSFKEAIDYAGDAMYWVDEKGAFRYVNRAAQNRLGYTETELLQMHVWDIDPNMPRDKWPDHVDDLKRAGSLTFEIEHRCRDHSQFPVQITASVMAFNDETMICAFARDISEIKAAERQLRASESRHRLLLEHAGLGIGYYDANGRCILMNRKACEQMQVRPDELVGRSVTELFGDEFGRLIAERIRKVVETGDVLTTEDEAVVPAGRAWYRSTWTPVREESGAISGVQIISEDIAEQRRAAQQITEERDLARQYLDTAGSLIVVMDRNACITTVNRHACDVLGYTRDELVGRDAITTMFDPEDHDQLRSLHSQVIQGDVPDYQEWQNRIRTKSGEERTVVWWNSVIRDTDGSVIGLIGSGVDVTGQLQLQAALSTKSELLKSILSTIPGYIFWKDAESRYLGCNPQFAEAAGLSSPDDVVGKTDYDLVWDRHEADFYRECDRKTIETGETILNIEETQRRPDGTVVDILTNKVPLRDDYGNVIGLLGIYTDITELKNKEKELQRRTHQLGERVKELSCMFNVMHIIRAEDGINDVLQAIVRQLPPGWQYPEITCARLRMDDQVFTTAVFQESPWVQHCPIMVNGEERGSIDVFYTEESPELDEGPFSTEERVLLTGIADVVSETIELRNAHAQLTRSHDFLQRLLDTIPQPVFYKDHEHIYRFVNRALCEYIGRPLNQFLGHNVFDVQPLSRAKEFNDQDRLLLTNGGTQEFETVLVSSDASVRPVRMHKAVLTRDDGSTEGLVGVITDLSEIKRKERELRESRDTLNAILTTIQTGLMLVDTETRTVTDVNSVAAKMIGRGRDYILGRPCSEFICASGKADCMAGAFAVEQSTREMTLKTYDNCDIPVINSITHVQLSDTSYQLQNFLDISDRVEAERALAASEQLYRALFENALDIVAILSDLGRIEYASPSLARTLGCNPETFHEVDIYELLHTEDVDAYGELQRDIIEEAQGNMALEFRLQHRDGSYRRFEGVFGVLPDVSGVPRMVVNARDVTERRREEVIQEVLNRISQATNITENLEDVVQFSHRQVTRVMAADNFYVALYDAGKDTYSLPYCVDEYDTVELNTPVCMDKTLTDYVRRTGLPLLADGELERELLESGEVELVGTDSLVWMGVPLKTLGDVFGVMVVQSYSRDTLYTDDDLHLLQRLADRISLVIERKRTEDDRKRLAIAVEQSAEAIMVTDTDGTIQYVNPAFERITGYTRAEVIGTNPSILKSGQHPPEFYRDLWAALSRGEQWQGRLINCRKDGTIYQEDATISPVRNSDGVIVNYVAVKRDVTQEIQMETQLRQAQKLEAVGSLAAGIAHEINTPIQFVGDNIRFMSDSFNDLVTLLDTTAELRETLRNRPEFEHCLLQLDTAYEKADITYLRDEIPRAITQTMDGVKRVASIVRAMKDFSHPDKGEKTPEDINRALVSTLTVARNELKYVADVKTELQENLPTVWCYISDLNQVFLNLLVNAAHAIADRIGKESVEKGTITARTRAEDGYVIVEISDTGNGIPPELRDRIFEPFFTTKPVGKGTGQGLAISRSVVVEKHGGALTFDTDVGVGSTFRVTLPIGEPKSSGKKLATLETQ